MKTFNTNRLQALIAMANKAAAFMSGVLDAKYEQGELSEDIKEEINKLLKDDDLEHISIENREEL